MTGSETAQIELIVYGVIFVLVGVGATVFGVFWKISTARKNDLDKIYSKIEKEGNKVEGLLDKKADELHSRVNDIQKDFNKVNRDLGRLEGRMDK